MSDLLILAGVLLTVVLIAALAYLVYSGLLSKVNVRTGPAPVKGLTLAYKYKQGPYREAGRLFWEACSISALPTVGIYYDDPKKVPAPKCRYVVGSILSEGEEKPSVELQQLYEKCGFRIFSLPEVTHVVSTRFPNRTGLSILLAVQKVYPQLSIYIKERKLCAHPFLEIYRDGLIYFMAPLAKQGDFYVPEVQEPPRRVKEEESEEDRRSDSTDSHSECSSVSHGSDSRDPSPSPIASSWYRDHQARDSDLAEHSDSDPDRQPSDRGSSGSSFEELDLETSRAAPESTPTPTCPADKTLSPGDRGSLVEGEE